MKKTVYTVTKDKKVQKETFNYSEKTSSPIVTDPSEQSEYIEQNMLNEGTIVTIEEESENGTTTVKTKLKYVTDEGEEFESTSTQPQQYLIQKEIKYKLIQTKSF